LLKPQARISLNYRAKEYLALLPSFCELHASLLENTTVLEISRVSCDVCLPSPLVLPGTWFTSAYLSSELSPSNRVSA